MIILFVFCITLALHIRYSSKFERLFPISIMIAMLTNFLLALFSMLSVINIVYGLLIVVLSIYIYKRRKGICIAKLITPAFVFCLILFPVIILCYSHQTITFADDFAYYAKFPKTLFYQVKLPDIETTTYTPYNSYSPLMGLWFVSVLRGCFLEFNEQVLFVVNIFTIYVFCLPLLYKAEWKKNQLSMLFRAIITILFPFCISTSILTNLGVDTVVGIVFSYGLYAIFSDENEKIYYLRIYLTLAVLVLLKTPTIYLAMILLLIFMYRNRVKIEEKKTRYIKFLVAACSFGVPYFSWNCWCFLHDMHDYLTVGVLSRILEVFQGKLVFPVYWRETLFNYFKSLGIVTINGAGFGITTVLVILLGILCYVFKHKSFKKEPKYLVSIYAFGGIVYCLMHYLMYIFVFDPNEAMELGSFGRYLAIYFTPIVYFVILIFVNGEKTKKIVDIIIMLMIVVFTPWMEMSKSFIPANYKFANEEKIWAREKVDSIFDISTITYKRGDWLWVAYNPEGTENIIATTLKYQAVPFPCVRFQPKEEEDILQYIRANNIKYIFIMESFQKELIENYLVVKEEGLQYETFYTIVDDGEVISLEKTESINE